MAPKKLKKVQNLAHFSRYHCFLHNVACKEMGRAFLWLYQSPSQCPWDYLKGKYSKSQIKKYFATIEIQKMKNKTPVTKMDISQIFGLMEHTCGLAPFGSKIWREPKMVDEQESVEHMAYLLKEQRNSLAHQPQEYWYLSKMDLCRLKEKVAHQIELMLKDAGKRSGQSNEDVARAILKMKSELEDYACISLNEDDDLSDFVEDARKELIKSFGSIAEPSFFVAPIFFNTKDSCNVTLSNIPVLQKDSTKSVVLMTGDLGMGKTIISEFLVVEWLKKKNGVLDLQQYSLLFFVRCGGVMPSTYEDYVRRTLRETIGRYDYHKAMQALYDMKVLWIIDGLDELRERANLVRDLISMNAPNHNIILTSRTEVAWDFIRSYEGTIEGEMMQEIMIRGLDPSRQTAFINGLVSRCSSQPLKETLNVLTRLRSLPQHLQYELTNPLKLSLFIRNPQTVMDISLGSLYRNISRNCMDDVMRRHRYNFPFMADRELYENLEQWFQFLCQTAFHMVQEGRYTVSTEDEEKLLKKCSNLGLCSSICLSAYLQHYRDTEGKTARRFLHGSQQRYLAACHIEHVLTESPHYSISQALFPCSLICTSLTEDVESTGKELTQVVKTDSVMSRIRRKSGENKGVQKRKGSLSSFQNLANFSGVFVFVTSCLSINGKLTRLRMDEMCDLLLESGIDENDTNVWFDVVREGEYSDIVVAAVAEAIFHERWSVTDVHITAACHLMCNVCPDALDVLVMGKPNLIPKLKTLLQKASKHDIQVSISLFSHFHCPIENDWSDEYLEILSMSTKGTKLEKFEGNLTPDGIKLLQNFREINFLSLRVINVKILEALSKFPWIKVKKLLLAVNVEKWCAKQKLSKLPCHNKTIVLALENLSDKNLNAPTYSIFQIATTYEQIILIDCALSDVGLLKLISNLNKHGVSARSLLTHSSEPGAQAIEFQPFPPPKKNMNKFLQIWHKDVEVEDSVNGTAKKSDT
ncbi:uncharacterized protein LOC143029766 isoform X1 [Oratosquilla oratoria]|uniref:uncharacterized protein LOC143029766 isoform X1 n=1 Tax=Oratosquilla oratoria TaxID=337810 RepID=UPI003F7638E9